MEPLIGKDNGVWNRFAARGGPVLSPASQLIVSHLCITDGTNPLTLNRRGGEGLDCFVTGQLHNDPA
jgi:hypothetical protein